MSAQQDVQMQLEGLKVEVPADTPMMILREVDDPHRVMGIYIGMPVARSIEYAREGHVPERPLTHDLIVNVFEDLGAHVSRVVITEMREHTYFAELHVLLGGQQHVISCRPSDAVAIAVRAEIPMFARRDLLDAVGVVIEEVDSAQEDEILDEFHQFLENVNPEDFQER